MKKLFGNLIVVMLLANGGCGLPTETQESSSEVQVQIPIHENGKPQIKTVTLKGIEDLSSVSGRYAIFYYAPKIEGENFSGSKARARFVKNPDGIYIPVDSISAEMAVIYYHLQNLTEFDTLVGLKGVTGGAHRVALSARIANSDDWLRDSAFYDMQSDSFVFVDFASQTLPLTINPGVIAHEYFHSIFSKLVLVPLQKKGKLSEKFVVAKMVESPQNKQEDSPEDFNSARFKALEKYLSEYTMIKALNEGLADFWGWLYVQDENFVSNSLPAHSLRTLKSGNRFKFPRAEYFKERIRALFSRYTEFSASSIQKMQFQLGSEAYLIGTMYARFFRQLMKDDDGQDLTGAAKEKFLTHFILFLKDLGIEASNSTQVTTLIQPTVLLERFRVLNPEIAKTHCQKFSEALGTECRP